MTDARAQRPLSITVIGIYLLLGAFLMPSNIHTGSPAFFVGLVFTGWKATVFFLAIGTVGAVLGIGLLRLAPWSGVAAIYFFVFRALNTLAILLVPHSRVRFKEGLDEVRATHGRPPLSSQMIWFGVMAFLVLMVVVLRFLIVRKDAFFGRAKHGVCSPPLSGGTI